MKDLYDGLRLDSCGAFIAYDMPRSRIAGLLKKAGAKTEPYDADDLMTDAKALGGIFCRVGFVFAGEALCMLCLWPLDERGGMRLGEADFAAVQCVLERRLGRGRASFARRGSWKGILDALFPPAHFSAWELEKAIVSHQMFDRFGPEHAVWIRPRRGFGQ